MAVFTARSVKALVVATVLAATGLVFMATAPTASATGATVTTISSSPNPSTVGQAVTITVTVTSTTVPGVFAAAVPVFELTPAPVLLGIATVTLDGTGPLHAFPTDHSSGSITISNLSKGSHLLSAIFLGGLGDDLPSPAPGFTTQTVNAHATTTTVTSAPNPSVFGQGVILSANVATNPASGHVPGGTVQFSVDGANVGGAVGLDGSGHADSVPVTGLSVGSHPIAAAYTSTDPQTLNSSGTGTINQQVNPADTTTAVTTSPPTSSVYGQPVTITATPSPQSPGAGTPTGSVTFTDGLATLGTAALSGGSASLTTSALSVGSHALAGAYSGDGNFNGSSGTANLTVDKAPTTTTVSSSVTPSSVYGQPVSFSALVCPGAASTDPVLAPTGTVDFFLDGNAVAFDTQTLAVSGPHCAAATANPLTTLSVGIHSLSAVYSSDTNYTASTSPTYSHEVTKAPTVTTLTAVPSSTTVNHAVVLTATVAPAMFAGPLSPTGTVSFYVDGSATPNTTVPLVGNTATYTTTFGGGSHTVVAVYNGDGNYLASTSMPATTVTVFCTTMITGTHSALTVTSGTTCVRNATITGGISVARGATLSVENTTVNGSISANAPDAIRVCGSQTGSIGVTAATGFVLIGDPGVGNCAANTVRGSIVAAHNRGGLVIVGNTVSGNVTAVDNSGSGPLLGETGPIVSGNHH